MPTFAIHEAVAMRIALKLGLSLYMDNSFILGNIAPDCWRNSLYYGNSDRTLSHFSSIDNNNEDYMKFFYKYSDKLDNNFVFGYLVHLMTDYYWRVFINNKKIIRGDKVYYMLEDGSIREDSIDNMSSFEKYNLNGLNKSFIIDYNIIKLNKLEDYSYLDQLIEEIDLSGLNKTIEYTNTLIDKKEEWDTPWFSYNTLDKVVSNIADTIINELLILNKKEKFTLKR